MNPTAPDADLVPGAHDSIAALSARIATFVAAREWQPFHNPKDLAVALIAEAGELLQHFVWQQPGQIADRAIERRSQIADEIADVGILLFELARHLDLDLGAEMSAKLQRNEQRYPIEHARGNNRKYSEFPDFTDP